MVAPPGPCGRRDTTFKGGFLEGIGYSYCQSSWAGKKSGALAIGKREQIHESESDAYNRMAPSLPSEEAGYDHHPEEVLVTDISGLHFEVVVALYHTRYQANFVKFQGLVNLGSFFFKAAI